MYVVLAAGGVLLALLVVGVVFNVLAVLGGLVVGTVRGLMRPVEDEDREVGV